MHVLDLVYGLIDRFVPMEANEKTALRNDAGSWYLKQTDNVFKDLKTKTTVEGFDPKTAKLKDKVIYWCENWAVRTGFAIAFIILVPMVQDFFTGGGEDKDDRERL